MENPMSYAATPGEVSVPPISQPEVAVIVPAYKAERFLPDCIRSVQAQSFKNWRLIVVDDGSPDSTGEIAEEFARGDNRICVVNRENGGPSAARNTGLSMVRDIPYVTFLDADDVLHPEFLSVMLRLQDGHTDRISVVPLVSFPATVSLGDRDGAPYSFFQKYMPLNPADTPPSRSFTRDEAIREILYQRRMDNSASGKLYPSHLTPPDIFREGIRYEDLDAFYRIFSEAEEIVFMPCALYGYRANPGSYIHTFNARRADVLDVGERMERYMALNNPPLLPAARSRLLSAYFNILALATTAPDDYPQLIRRSMSGIRRLRRGALLDRNVRLKNKAAIIASYIGGRRLLQTLAGLFTGHPAQ